jgi:N-glycosylase/DNA lyase
MTDLTAIYARIRPAVEARLEDFRRLWATGSDKDVFKEMCFCCCTPQNNARKAWDAVCRLDEQGLLETGAVSEIAEVLHSGVRFHQNKAGYIVKNRGEFYPDTKAAISRILQIESPIQAGTGVKNEAQNGAQNEAGSEARNRLAERAAGWGLKEASHFLRNIGFGGGICILDRHILRQLAGYGIWTERPLTRAVYLETEQQMIGFAGRESIPVDVLDLVLWFKEKGELFK